MFSSEVIDLWDHYIADWNFFISDYLGIELDDEQQAAIHAIQHNPKVAIASGTSRGKDFVIACAAMCFLYLTPQWDENGRMLANTKVALTAPTGRQVKDIMRPEINRIFNNSPYLPGWLTGNDIRTDYPEWFLTGFKADEHNTEAWTGFHASNVFFGVTEATGLPQKVFDAIEGNLQGNSRLVIVFNPNINYGYAASAFKSPFFVKIRLNSLNAPNVVSKRIVHQGQVDYDWVKGRIDEWCMRIDQAEFSETDGDFKFEGLLYRPNDLFRSKVLGLFPKVSEGTLIPVEWIEAANKRWKEMQTGNIITPGGISGTPARVALVTKALRLGVDVAGMGRDNSSFCHRYGSYVSKFEKMQGGGSANHMEVVGKMIASMKEVNAASNGQTAQSFVDTIGEGAGAYSRAIELGDSTEPWLKGKVHSCKFSEAAESNGIPLKDITGQYAFLNMRAYLYWAVRDWLNPANKNEPALPTDDELLQELTETQWKFMSNGKIQIELKEEIKKRLKRSPDKADALANTFYPVPDIDPNPKKRKNVASFFH
jgi:hypothetical protein